VTVALRRLGVVALALAASAGCGGSGSSDPPEETSTAQELVNAVPLFGVLIADCTDASTASVSETQDDVPETPVPLIELPQADTLVADDVDEFLLQLELHGDELPILAGLTSSIEDPRLFLPMPLDEVLALLAPSGIPIGTPVLGSTTFGCGTELESPPFGLVPVFGGVQSS
jgi:hypothetical protein